MKTTCRQLAVFYGFLVLGICLLPVERAFSLYNVSVPEKMQSQEKKPIKRTISLKLPIEDVHFHWEFLDKAELLAGKLLLRIIRDGKAEEIIVFQDGKFSDGWGPLVDQSLGQTGKNPIYFGFKSLGTYFTAPGDVVEIELTTNQDLKGIGTLLAGYLPAGTYTSKTKSSWLTDRSQTGLPTEFQQNAAFESWPKQWSVIVTSNQGWTPPDQADALRKMMKQLDDTQGKSNTKPKSKEDDLKTVP